jgi:hypothetical protein
MEQDEHLSALRIRLITDGQLLMRPADVQHIQSCDECGSAWWRCYLDAMRRLKSEEKKTA